MTTANIKLDQNLMQRATIMVKAFSRTKPKQVEHWAKIGVGIDIGKP